MRSEVLSQDPTDNRPILDELLDRYGQRDPATLPTGLEEARESSASTTSADTHRACLRVSLSMATAVGKTYAMLRRGTAARVLFITASARFRHYSKVQ